MNITTKNKLEWWRLELKIKHQKDFAPLIGVSTNRLSKYENHIEEPTRDVLVRMWLNLQKNFPERCGDIHLEDLLEISEAE